MIDNGTPDRIAQLGTTIADATAELEQLFRALSAEADAQLAQAAQAFLEQHGNPTDTNRTLLASYVEARGRLLAASVAAGNIADLSKRSTTARHQGAWWGSLMGSRSVANDVRAVCSHSVPAASDTQGCGGLPVASDRLATE